MAKELNKNVQILSIEAKDLITKNCVIKKDTFYKGSLDDSMEVDQLKKIGKKIIKFNKKTERFYTNDIITVTFKYSSNENLNDEDSERVASLEKTLDIINSSKTDKEEKQKQIKEVKELLQIAKKNLNRKTLRELLYKDGFNITIDGEKKHFVRYKRSSGSARVGKCLFINENYHKKMINWSFAGIKHKVGTEMDCSSIESYISLPTSSCIDRFKLKPENILLIEDGKSTFKDTVMATRLVNEVKDDKGNVIDGDLDTHVEETEITNKIWDGENLLDKSVFEENGYSDKAILQIRNRFFKGIGINTDIQGFFRDNNITEISQLNGQTIATDIKDIKLICTPSSVKYLKYGTFDKWLKYIVEDWGICKYEKPQKHFNGMVQTHYQLINTLGMDYDTTYSLLKDTLEYIDLLKNNLGVFKYHLGILSENNQEIIDKDYEVQNISSNAGFILSMLEVSDDFAKTRICKKFRKEIVENYIKNVRRGHILVPGNYSVVISCPYEFLRASIGKWNGESLLNPFECVCSKFEEGEEILGVRSPQPTMSNMSVFKNTKKEILDKYFNTSSQQVIIISSIDNNVFELESSMDVDGDQMLVTNKKEIVESCKNFNEKVKTKYGVINRFLVPTDFTPKTSIKKKYDWRDLADTDIKNSSNKIGEIINLAQQLNTIYWNKKFQGCDEDELLELYKDICQLDILSCIEIDRCKKLSPVNAQKEIDKIRAKKYLGKGCIIRNKSKKEVGIRPYFFKFLDGGKDYKFRKFDCGMDLLEVIIDEKIKRKENDEEELELKDILVKQKADKNAKNKIHKIIYYLKIMNYKQNKIWNSDIENKWELTEEIYRYYLKEISKIKMDQQLIYTILLRMSYANNNEKYQEYKKFGRKILRILYDINRKDLLKSIKINKKALSYVEENPDGNLNLYGLSFKNVSK
ncbi:hypothetical protein [Clostridium perfringens]|jgi:hypothetical protein|uniref:RNA dependent RNA polymerase n=1 Tax=Clostridium perfringens TaxID=1502 RepID=A0AAW4IYF4_CLOPF|nr:hypothetical protein [Clostridium perfringens]MBO3356280.1 hypothetical protein [Clostridium perfringens]MBO3359379.1 hypothetical protein [Clostridium perfringens]